MKSDTTLSKSTYLNTPTVKAFVHYVTSLIDGAPFKHAIVVRDPKLPANDPRITNPTFVIESLESAFDGYWWDKQGYEANAQKLRQVQTTIRSSMKFENAPNGATEAIHALSEVLEWGAGGTGQKLYTANMLWAKARNDTLIDSLRIGRAEMMSDTPNINAFKASDTLTYARMNAGFTKYYALACDNVVIYDGRVGAALGLLVKNFCKANQIQYLPNELAFRWGAQNGINPLNRDPSDEIFKFSKLPAEGAIWAEWNIKANWILSAAQNTAHAEWCKNSDGLRRLEAALFVIGYSMPIETPTALNASAKKSLISQKASMDKKEFLSNPDVTGFVDWLSKDLPSRTFHLNISASRFVPHGLNAQVKGIENVLAHYFWNAYWDDTRSNKRVHSSDWKSTKKSLAMLSQWLQTSINNNDQKSAYEATRAVMKWGGVSGASRLMRQLFESKSLVNYLESTGKLLAVNDVPSQKISDINSENIIKFDSGLTKIHALHANDGSPIYDTRVAAAISLLYCLYRECCPSSVKSILHFPCGSARGNQLRNPGDLGFKASKKFYTEIQHHEWAQTQLRLGWIFWDLLNKNRDLFNQEGTLAERAHALEGSLFVLGYDLRCFEVKPQAVLNKMTNSLKVPKTKSFGLVPTGHTFAKIVNEFVRLRMLGRARTSAEFVAEMFPDSHLKDSTKKDYLFPLKSNEFDLLEASTDSLQSLSNDSLAWLNQEFNDEGFSLPDERRFVCLQNAWLVGYMNRHLPNSDQNSLLVKTNFAGKKSSASLIRTVGKDVGIFFKLLDEQGVPTEAYDKFFCQDMTELDSKFLDVINAR
jgi:hypothetical protein